MWISTMSPRMSPRMSPISGVDNLPMTQEYRLKLPDYVLQKWHKWAEHNDLSLKSLIIVAMNHYARSQDFLNMPQVGDIKNQSGKPVTPVKQVTKPTSSVSNSWLDDEDDDWTATFEALEAAPDADMD